MSITAISGYNYDIVVTVITIFAVGQEVVTEHGVPGVDKTRCRDLTGALLGQTQEFPPSSRRHLVKVLVHLLVSNLELKNPVLCFSTLRAVIVLNFFELVAHYLVKKFGRTLVKLNQNDENVQFFTCLIGYLRPFRHTCENSTAHLYV